MDQDKGNYAGAEQGRGAVYDNYGYQAELASRLHRDWPHGQKQVYVSQSTLYDSWSNMPGESESSSHVNCKRCFLVLGIILLISGIIAGIVLAIYFSQRDSIAPETTTVAGTTLPPTTIPVPKTDHIKMKKSDTSDQFVKVYKVQMKVNDTFTDSLKDPNSTEYKKKEKYFKNKMDNIYKNSSLADIYNGTEILGFTNGSIIVDLRVHFILKDTVTPAARNVTSPPGSNTTMTPTQPLDIMKSIEQAIKKQAEYLNLATNKIAVVEIEIIQTTANPIVTTTPKQAVTEKITEMVTETTKQPDLPFTEPSKTSKTSEDLTSAEPQTPTKQTITTLPNTNAPATTAPAPTTHSKTDAPVPTTPSKTDAPVPTTPSKTDAPVPTTPSKTDAPVPTTPSKTDAPAPQTTLPLVTTQIVSRVPTVKETTPNPDKPTVPPPPKPTESPTQNPTETNNYTTSSTPNITATDYAETTMSSFMTTQPYVSDNCNPGLASCKNAQCIRRDWFCDNYIDCLDASDEDDAQCGRTTTKPPIPRQKSTGRDLDCNFESLTKELCNYKTSPGFYNWSVTRGPTSSNNTGPDFDHTFLNSNGRFLFTESSYASYNDNATLTSVTVTTDSSSRSLTFYYHMYGARMGSLKVYFNIVTRGLQRVLKWSESGNHGNVWLKACIEMPKDAKLSVEFVAYRGLNYTSDIAMDDIKYSTDKCESVSCTYEDDNCGHSISNLGNISSDSYAWRRVRGEDMEGKLLAPKTDFSRGKEYGAFLIADSSKGNPGDNATFQTPPIRTSKTTTLNFRLYISGSSIGTLQLNLLSQPDFGSNLTYKTSGITNGWKRICVLVPKDFDGVAEFEAIRGNGVSGYIAVDDVALGPETTCEGFSSCRFENGLFCNFDITGNEYRWQRHSASNGHYLIAGGDGAEDTKTKLVSPKITPTPNSSIRFRYSIKGTPILSVWAKPTNNGKQEKTKLWTTEGMMNGVQTTPSIADSLNSLANSQIQKNVNKKRMDWLTGCFDLTMANDVSIEIVSRKLDRQGGEVSLDWVQVHEKQCEIGLGYRACDFEDPNLCGYEIECPISTQYKWKRISGSTPTTSTGPLRDHTYNSTIGNYLYTEGSVGQPGDKAVVTFMDVQTAINTSLRFHYYMSGRDIGSLYIIIGSKSRQINWIQEGEKSPFWYVGCVDLPSDGRKVNVSFIGTHGNGPLSDIAIDDVHLFDGRCPERLISCDFENEMMCGYTGLSTHNMRTEASFNEQWVRTNGTSAVVPQHDHTLNSSNGHFLYTMLPSKIMSPRIAYGQTMCLQFYYYIQMGKGQNISVTADYENSAKNKVKVVGTNGYSLAGWRHGQMTLLSGNLSVIFSVEHYNQEISSTFFAIDDVSINYKKCPETVCAEEMYKCQKDDICIPDYKKCDWVRDCSDGADELSCPANMSTIRLIDGVTSGAQGRLEINVNGTWGTAYSLRWFESNAKVACRQLGYTGYYKSVRFGKFFFGLGDVWQINCNGNETSLQDCEKVNVVYTIPHLYDVGLACYNTVCEPGKTVCPKVANSSVVYCLYSNQFCDGDFDCPGGEDEKNCHNCSSNEFACKNPQCIPNSERCNGEPNCRDASDEMNCIRRDVESNVELYYNNSWMPLCDYGHNEAFYSSLCLIMGQGVANRKTISNSTAIGFVPVKSHSIMTAIGKYKLAVSSTPCPKMKLQCHGQECGSRSQRMFDPFVQFGSQAVPTEYPWQVMLLRNGNFHCGASIFNSRWLITAEHCVVERYVKYEVVAGLLRMQDLNKFPRIQVIQIIHSMNYGNYKGIPINDIALILLEKDLVFNDYIRPVCLPSKVYTSKDYCYLSGWGRDENLVGQSHLKETKVYAITSEECKKYYDNITDNSFICFGHHQPNMPSCYGDSGGPLVCRNDRGRFELVGVVSFGLPLCAASNGTPAAFTNVLNFRGWIVDQTRCKMWCPNGKCLYEAETCDGIDHCRDRSDELPPKCTQTVACNFGKAYKCGYRNDSVHPWYWSSPHWSTPYMKSKPMIGGDAETDEYMLASVNATKSSPAKLISPNVTEIPCISFKYLANANNSAITALKLKALGQDSSSYRVIWDNDKNNTQEQMFWKLATVSLPNMTTSLMFEAYYENPNEYSFIAIDSIKVMDKDCTVCHATEFQCNSGHCINATQVCDGSQQCSDASDELNCFKPTPAAVCSSDHFQCSNGQCVFKDRKCNGNKDCIDGSDENNCTKPIGPCSWDQFRCNDGQCIEHYLRCDGVWHCKDGSDEMFCHKTTISPEGNCNWDHFRCDDGSCIQSYFKCDGISQCKDLSDEKYCFRTSTQFPGICKWNQFRCNNGQCIDFHLKCDNIKQCRDGSDEQYCGDKSTIQPGGCTWDQFRCDNGQCIQAFLRCDRMWHCKDGSDEQNCPLSTQIPEHQCRRDQVHCSDGFCIQRNLRCDGIWHCMDGSDEESCFSTTDATTVHCRWDQFRCNDGNCIESHLKCDGESHCKDGSDERYCYRTSTAYPGPCLLSQFRCNNGQCIESFLKCDKVKHCKDGSDEQYCGAATIQPQGICRWDQFHCKDGQCIEYYHKCDQIWHCKDGSDEQNCPKALIKNQGCKYNEFGCLDGKCIENILVCNHNNDCSLGEDEHNCTNTTHPMTTEMPTTRGMTTDSATKIPLIKGILPLVTKTIILPGRSTIVPLVTAAPILHGTRIHIPLVTAAPIRRGTRINIPLVTKDSLQRGTSFNITLVTAVPIQRGTSFNITLVTEAPLQRGTRINISHVSKTSIQSHKTDSPHLTISPVYPRSVIIPNATATTTKHGTRINVPSIKIHHRTTRTNVLLVTASHTQHYMRTVSPIHHDRKEPSTVRGTTIHPQRSTAVTLPHKTNFPHISTNAVQHKTKINIPYVTATPPFHKTGHSHVTATSTPRHKTPPPYATTIVGHHKRISTPHVKKTSSAHLTTTDKLPMTHWNLPFVTSRSNQHMTSSVPTLFSTTTQACAADEFRCDDKQCIPETFVCDVIPDCDNAKDELGCDDDDLAPTVKTTEPNACLPNEFICDQSQCIPNLFVCDDIPDCDNGRDELECDKTATTLLPKTCQINEFRCSNGECILKSKRCDKMLDCSDNSDEQNCGYTIPSTTAPITMESTTMSPTTAACAADEFRCDDKQCIPETFVCDVIPDCDNAKDELGCDDDDLAPTVKTTEPNVCPEFRCSNGECILKSKSCDKTFDCADKSDEQNCTYPIPSTTAKITTTKSTTMRPTTNACAQNEFRCPGSKCISIKDVCDHYKDCPDGADEYCFTTVTKFPITTLSILQTTKECSQTECSQTGNRSTENRSTERSPISLRQKAYFGSLWRACAQNQFRCPGSKCIPINDRCDKYKDCPDGADEKDCPSANAAKVPLSKGCAVNEFQCGNGLCIPMIKYCDQHQDCVDGSDEKCRLSSTSKPKSTMKGCSYDDFRCDNGQCIPLSFHCDSLFDCNDRSDEKNCSPLTPTLSSIQGCEVNEFRCQNGLCIKLAFVCDGLFDCPDTTDEHDCPVITPTQATTTTDFKICRKNEYECPSGKCINADYVCDDIPDCPSADDEASCLLVSTTSSPKSSIPPSDKCFPLAVKECLQVGYSRTLLPNVFGDKTFTQAMERFYTQAMPIIAHQCSSKKALMLFCGTIFPLCKDGVSKYTCKSVCREVEQSCGKDSILMNTCDWLVDDERWCFIGLTENQELQGNRTTRRSPLPPNTPNTQGCQKGFYQCKNSNICLHPIHLCDGEPTCPQADDEHENCSCQPNQFRCASGQCVMESRRCNGYQDCKDYSDEHNCSVTECVGRLCTSGQCVSSNSFCDGIFDCDDLSDEKLCECKPPHRRCDNQVCVTANKWCNREDDCGDNSDERNCDCSIGELMCSDGKCIPMEWWCDGNRDCSDGKDEAHCHWKTNSSSRGDLTTTTTTTPTVITTTVPTTAAIVFPFKDNCQPDEFICTRGYKCIKRTRVCDMKWDCDDGEDEATCVTLRKETVTNSTAILTLTVQGQTSMVCSSKWTKDWASFICKYLRHKGVKNVEFVDPPPGTTAFQQVPSHQLEFPEEGFIKTIRTCETNKIVSMECNERIKEGVWGTPSCVVWNNCWQYRSICVPNAAEIDSSVCGTNRHYSIKYQEFVIGGDLARRYTWPWAVSLLYLGEPICGATLISERWLVTAAHCIVTGMWNRTKVPHYFSAILGEVDLFKGLMNGTRIPIDKIVLPGDMKLVVFNPDPDIALLRLKYPVQRVRQIEPICMPKLPKHDHGSTCYLAGWGGTHRPGEDRRRYSNFLHEVRMIIRNSSDCSTFRPQPNWEHNICAGYLESTITGCYGDNGGALMCWEPDNRWTLVGILSKGRYNCAANSPNVFTKISPMREWIEGSMGWTVEDEF